MTCISALREVLSPAMAATSWGGDPCTSLYYVREGASTLERPTRAKGHATCGHVPRDPINIAPTRGARAHVRVARNG